MSDNDSTEPLILQRNSDLHIKHVLFDKFDVGIVLDETNRFISVESIKISKSFIDTNKLNIKGMSAEELVDKYLNEQEV